MRYKGLNERIDTMNEKQIQIRQNILELYNQGLNNREIAQAIGLKGSTSLTYYMQELGLQSNHKGNLPIKERMDKKEYEILVEKIRTCAENNWSKNKTFTNLKISKSNLANIIKEEKIVFKNQKDINNSILNHDTIEEREKCFAEKLHQNDNTKEYVKGYVNGDSFVEVKCLLCNSIIKVNAQSVRHKTKIRCKKCNGINKAKKDFEKKQKQQEENQIKNTEKYFKELEKILNSEQMAMKVCEQCGSLFLGNKKYCSDKCCKKAGNKKRDISRRLKIKNNGNADYTISLEKLIKRDNNICYLCGKDCNLEDYTYQGNTFIAGNYYPSIEHVIPLSKGGTHTWDNVKLAHRICNTMKGNR